MNILGASARAAAFSALRACFEPTACDMFGDADLRAAARFEPLGGPYPDGLAPSLARMAAEAPFIYTGGLEGHPDLVDELARLRPLWGNDGACLRRARDPFVALSLLERAGARPPETRPGADPPRDPEGWLLKPVRGSGGAGIRPAAGPPPADPAGFVYQRRVPGASCSALFAVAGGRSELLGVTRQLVGEPWLHAAPFAWCGSVGPAPLPRRAEAALRDAGDAAARGLGLRGLFGIDFLLDGEVLQPVDLNPRYPASTEVLEHALGFAALAWHAAAFTGARPPDPPPPAACGGLTGKAVLFAPWDLVATSDLLASPPDPCRLPRLADLPARGAVIRRGRPVLTVFAGSGTIEACVEALRRSAHRALGYFQPAGRASYYDA
ncbi:MAG: ATP-grasp domain-containing protein [Planctomycetes bacterium]|nr:ATP-grasp domain-containing protein [Planctomycetota bacterium]